MHHTYRNNHFRLNYAVDEFLKFKLCSRLLLMHIQIKR